MKAKLWRCGLCLMATTTFGATNVLQVFNNDFGQAPATHIDPTINVGDTVEWVWASGTVLHSTTAAAGQLENWDSGVHAQPFTFDHTFTQPGSYNYYCTVHGFDAGGGQVGGMSGSVHVVNPVPGLSVTKFAAGRVALGGDLSYTITVTNSALTTATGVLLTDALPANATFVSADASQGNCAEDAGVVSCDLGDLDAGAGAIVTVVVTANAAGMVCNNAMVTGLVGDSVSTNVSSPACASVVVHDLAVTAIKAPKTIALTATKTNQTKFVRVTVQNRSDHSEMIMNLDGLVTLELESIGTNCVPPEARLAVGPPQRRLPVTLKPKQKLPVVFMVTYDCANDRAKGAGHEDFRYRATVHHEALDDQPDSDPADDSCPRGALGGPFKDRGCSPVATDVTVK
jgi:uncharacterized repeat protein (TIGR01451 family)